MEAVHFNHNHIKLCISLGRRGVMKAIVSIEKYVIQIMQRKEYTMKKNIFMSSLCVGLLVSSLQAAVPEEQTSHDKLKHIWENAEELVIVAHARFEASCSFKKLVWTMNDLCEGMNRNVLVLLKEVQSDVANDSSLHTAVSKMVSILEAVCEELNTLKNGLHTYERTKNPEDAYKIAQVFKKFEHAFRNKERIQKFKAEVEEIINLLAKKSGYNDFVHYIADAKKSLESLEIQDSSNTKEDLSFLRFLMDIIRHN